MTNRKATASKHEIWKGRLPACEPAKVDDLNRPEIDYILDSFPIFPDRAIKLHSHYHTKNTRRIL
ncbi:MAG: hypothetical protein NTZ94_18600 [Verrucomicrobia bacterium]|nr:hypothetical protein [Verrucomicrobiota bacterium]